MWYVKLSPAVEKFSADVQLSHKQLSRMFSVFKNAFMAGLQPVEGTTIDVDDALSQLEKQVVTIGQGVRSGRNMSARRTSNAGDSDDDFVTPAKKGKKIVKKEANLKTIQAEGGEFSTVVTPNQQIDTSTGSGVAS